MYGQYSEEFRPELDIDPPARQRRLTVLLRALLLIPHFIVLIAAGIVTFFAAIFAWFGALALGRLPRWAADYLGGYLRYATGVYASFYLLIDSYPPFSFSGAPDFPVRVELRPTELNRLAVLLRIILVIPAAILSGVISAGWSALAFFCWLVVLILGRNPAGLFESTAAIVRYQLRTDAYFLMLTPAYPKGLFGDAGTRDAGEAVSATHPLRVGTGGKVLLVIFIVVGLASSISSDAYSSSDNSGASYSSPASL
ncbi:MAG: DUF4389 domain-containing protein [Streptosporangiaceae bacterium]|jgi:hypothetical protein